MNGRTDLMIVEGFLTPERCQELIDMPGEPLAEGRHDWPMPQGELDEQVWQISDMLKEFYEIPEDLYADYVAMTKSRVGMGHVLHADNETQEGGPNHTAWRQVTSMLYLNTEGVDFQGGSIQFPRIGEEVHPRAGLLVGFRCDGIHSHQVPPVTEGVRRAVATWFTPDTAYKGTYAPKG